MVTKREYLIQKGLAKEGRGRLSAAAHDEIKKAINKGVKFDEGTNDSTGVSETPRPRTDRPEGMYTFMNPDGTTFKRLHTLACARCSYSLQWCYCMEGPVSWRSPHRMGEGEVYATLYVVPSSVITTNDVPEKQPTQGVPRRGRGRPRGSRNQAKAA